MGGQNRPPTFTSQLNNNSMFTSTMNKGFQLTFENGWKISVQWGPGNYCENRNMGNFKEPASRIKWESLTAEIAIWKGTSDYTFENGDIVKGHLTTNEVAEWITKVSMW